MRKGRALVGAVVVVALIGGGVYLAIQRGIGPLPDPDRCVAEADNYSVALSTGQAENASVIAAVAERRGLPARAISIAIATAYQESKLENLGAGDRDSLGLFQQRPSQGWGTPKQIMDPYYAANAFYDALVKVDGYETMKIAEAAQQVQRSAFPDAYADHEKDGRTIASDMAGYSPASFSCTTKPEVLAAEKMTRSGLTPRAEAVRSDVRKVFGELSLGGFEPGGVDGGHMNGSAHYEGRAIDVFFRPASSDNTRKGWVLAHYLVANADRLHIRHVIFDGRIWTGGSLSEEGWRTYRPRLRGDESDQTKAILLHRDHVHVDVAAGPQRRRAFGRGAPPATAGRLRCTASTRPARCQARPRHRPTDRRSPSRRPADLAPLRHPRVLHRLRGNPEQGKPIQPAAPPRPGADRRSPPISWHGYARATRDWMPAPNATSPSV